MNSVRSAMMVTALIVILSSTSALTGAKIASAEIQPKTIQAQDFIEPEIVKITTEETSEQEQTVQETSQIFQETTAQPEEESKNIEPEYRHYAIIDGDTEFIMPIEHQDFVWQMCSEYGIKEYYTLMLALSYHESKYNPNTVSRTNDYGYMQINKCNHNWLRKTLGVNDFLNPFENIRCGVYMFSDLVHKYGNPEKALVGYNGGEKYAKKYSSTKYSRAVLQAQQKLTALD